jgi:Flp pilus assembly protein TadB
VVSYGLKLAGAAALILFAGVAAMVIFGNIWFKVGLGAAIVIVCGALLLWAWSVDRKGRKAREGLDELPPI